MDIYSAALEITQRLINQNFIKNDDYVDVLSIVEDILEDYSAETYNYELENG